MNLRQRSAPPRMVSEKFPCNISTFNCRRRATSRPALGLPQESLQALRPTAPATPADKTPQLGDGYERGCKTLGSTASGSTLAESKFKFNLVHEVVKRVCMKGAAVQGLSLGNPSSLKLSSADLSLLLLRCALPLPSRSR